MALNLELVRLGGMGQYTSTSDKKHAILLGKGRYADEFAGFSGQDGPRPEFIAIAQKTRADIFSYTSAAARRNKLFGKIFSRRPAIGAAWDFALNARRYDSCYVTGEDIALPLAAMLAVRGWSGRLVCVVHNITRRKAMLLRLIGHRRFASFVVVTNQQRRALIERCGIPENKVCRVSNWVDDQFFTPPSSTPANDIPVVMACGAENRDYGTLVSAARECNAVFKIYAHGFFDSTEGSLGDASNVRQMPRVSFADLRRAYRECDVVAIPLNDVDYAAGVTGLVEAMACGKAIVVTRSNGLTDYFDTFLPSHLVNPFDTKSMFQSITSTIQMGPAQRQDIGRRHRLWIEKHCSLDAYAAKIHDLMSV